MTVVLPSPGTVEEISIVTHLLSLGSTKCKLVLILRNASLKKRTFTFSGKIPYKGVSVNSLITDASRILLSSIALNAVKSIPNISPKINPTATISFLLGLIGFNPSLAFSIICVLAMVEAFEISNSIFFCNKKV